MYLQHNHHNIYWFLVILGVQDILTYHRRRLFPPLMTAHWRTTMQSTILCSTIQYTASTLTTVSSHQYQMKISHRNIVKHCLTIPSTASLKNLRRRRQEKAPHCVTTSSYNTLAQQRTYWMRTVVNMIK